MSNCNFYISYCRADGQDIAVQLGKQLTEKGYSVFIDKEKLVSGSDFAHNIADAISNCDYFVPIITDATSKSQSAMNEIYFAFYTAKSRATKVIPIVVTQELDTFMLGFRGQEMKNTTVTMCWRDCLDLALLKRIEKVELFIYIQLCVRWS